MTSAPVAANGYYNSLGPLYDRLKATDDLQTWVDLLLDTAGFPHGNQRRVLDLGCGTGGSSRAFANRGFDVTGCDSSSAMLRVARARHPEGRYLQADIRRLPAHLTGFDIVNYMGDVPNHLLEEDDVVAALTCAARALAPTGIVMFDVNTITAYQQLFTAQHVIDRGDATFLWLGETLHAQPNTLAHLRVIAFHEKGDLWQRTDASLTERHYDPATLTRLIAQAGLRACSVHGLHRGQLVTPADENIHMKLVYMAELNP